jgi:hypothetical protein
MVVAYKTGNARSSHIYFLQNSQNNKKEKIMNKWLKNKQNQRKIQKLNTQKLNLLDAFFKLTLIAENSTVIMNDFAKSYSRR